MGFTLGNHNIDEILYAVAQNFSDEILFTVDQLSTAQIEVSAQSTDITDKNGNIVRRTFNSKTAAFTSTNAFLHPGVMNAGSGSDIIEASSSAPIKMPAIRIIAAGASFTPTNVVEGTIHAIGLFNNGANGKALHSGTEASYADGTFKLEADTNKITMPAADDGNPIQYLVKYERSVESGVELTNDSELFPKTCHLTLLASYVDPCSDTLKPCYIYMPSFMPNPDMTISFSRSTQELNFNGTAQMDYCSKEGKILYAIYYPDEELVTTVVSDVDDDTPDDPTPPITVTHTVTQNLTNVTSNFSDATVNEGATLTITLTPEETYTLGTVTVTMGGTNITSSAYDAGVVTIASVTGDIVITAEATQ